MPCPEALSLPPPADHRADSQLRRVESRVHRYSVRPPGGAAPRDIRGRRVHNTASSEPSLDDSRPGVAPTRAVFAIHHARDPCHALLIVGAPFRPFEPAPGLLPMPPRKGSRPPLARVRDPCPTIPGRGLYAPARRIVDTRLASVRSLSNGLDNHAGCSSSVSGGLQERGEGGGEPRVRLRATCWGFWGPAVRPPGPRRGRRGASREARRESACMSTRPKVRSLVPGCGRARDQGRAPRRTPRKCNGCRRGPRGRRCGACRGRGWRGRGRLPRVHRGRSTRSPRPRQAPHRRPIRAKGSLPAVSQRRQLRAELAPIGTSLARLGRAVMGKARRQRPAPIGVRSIGQGRLGISHSTAFRRARPRPR